MGEEVKQISWEKNHKVSAIFAPHEITTEEKEEEKERGAKVAFREKKAVKRVISGGVRRGSLKKHR